MFTVIACVGVATFLYWEQLKIRAELKELAKQILEIEENKK